MRANIRALVSSFCILLSHFSSFSARFSRYIFYVRNARPNSSFFPALYVSIYDTWCLVPMYKRTVGRHLRGRLSLAGIYRHIKCYNSSSDNITTPALTPCSPIYQAPYTIYCSIPGILYRVVCIFTL